MRNLKICDVRKFRNVETPNSFSGKWPAVSRWFFPKSTSPPLLIMLRALLLFTHLDKCALWGPFGGKTLSIEHSGDGFVVCLGSRLVVK